MGDDYYSEIAAGYDELYGEEQDAKLRELLARTKQRDGLRVLDVGCGTGRSCAFFGNMEWFGLDPSVGLIAHAPPVIHDRITCCTAEEMPYPEEQFAIVLSVTALQNFANPRRGLEQIRRVCTSDGVILLSFLKKSERRDELDALVREVLAVREAWESEKDMMYVCTPQ